MLAKNKEAARGTSNLPINHIIQEHNIISTMNDPQKFIDTTFNF